MLMSICEHIYDGKGQATEKINKKNKKKSKSCLCFEKKISFDSNHVSSTSDTHITIYQGPFDQSVISLTSSLVVKMLTVVVSKISNSQVFLLKNVSSFCKCKSYSHFFSKNINVYAIFNDRSFNHMLTNNIISFEQLGPDIYRSSKHTNMCP